MTAIDTNSFDFGDTGIRTIDLPQCRIVDEGDDAIAKMLLLFDTIREIITIPCMNSLVFSDIEYELRDGGYIYITQQEVADDFSDFDVKRFKTADRHILLISCRQQFDEDVMATAIKCVEQLCAETGDKEMKWGLNVNPAKERNEIVLISISLGYCSQLLQPVEI